MKILIAIEVNDYHKEWLRESAPDAEIVYANGAQVDEALVKSADIIVGNVSPAYIKGSEKLRLMQLNSAGTDGYITPGVMPTQATLCNAKGAYGVAVSEHMLGMLFCLIKKLDQYRLNMEEPIWKSYGKVTSVYGANTLIVGMGDIGSEFAKRVHALGSSVTAIRRTEAPKPDYIDALYQMDRLYDCLEQADIVFACLPGTKDTVNVFDKEAFSHMKKNAIFLNAGRGTSVDTDALCEALEKGDIGGAGLDVTNPEPLPADHPLWKAPKVLITPHVAGGFNLQETHDRIIRIAAKNIRHCLAGEPFDNVVDMHTGY